MINIPMILLSVFATVLIMISILRPEILNQNGLLKEFVTRDVLNIMGVIMAIAIPSVTTIHIWFNELEERHNRRVFGAARREINQDAYLLIILFFMQFVLFITRYYFEFSDIAVALFNSGAVLIFIASIITLIDVLNVVRSLTPNE